MERLINSYFQCEEEFRTYLGSNFRAVELKSSKEFKQHINLFILNPELNKNEKIKSFFEDKQVIAGQITDPRLIRLKGMERINDDWLFIKEYVPGIRLSKIIYEENFPPVPLNVAFYVFKEICEAFTSIYAHLSPNGNFHGFIHPFNVLLTESGEIKIDNFFFGKTFSGLTIKRENFLEFYGQNLPADDNNLIQFGVETDLIQLGMLFLELLVGIKIPRYIFSPDIGSLLESSKTDSSSRAVELLKEETVQFIERVIQISAEENFSSFQDLKESLSFLLEKNNYIPLRDDLLLYLSTHLKPEFESLAATLKSEETRNYGQEKEEEPEESEKIYEKTSDSYSQGNYDQSLSLIKEALSEFPGMNKFLNLKEKIEQEIKHKIEETKVNIRIGNYNEALKNINEYLSRSPKKFAGLEKGKKYIEKKLEKKFVAAKELFNKGKGKNSLEFLKELVSIPESDVVKSNLEIIQQMMKEIEEPATPETAPRVQAAKESETEEKLRKATLKIEANELEEAKEILNEILESDPGSKEADKWLKLMEAGSEEILNLFWQNRFDEALLAVSIQQAKNPESQEILSYRWRIESVIAQKIEEIKSAIKQENYKKALEEINDALQKSPKAFKNLNQFVKDIEQHAKDMLSQAQESYKKGDREKSLALLREIKEINQDNVIEPSLETIQKWIETVEGRERKLEEKWKEESAEEIGLSKPAVSEKEKGKTIGWIKNHPLAFAGAVGALVILIGGAIFLSKSGLIKQGANLRSSTGYLLFIKQEGIDYTGVSAVIDNIPLAIDQQTAQEIRVGSHELEFQKENHTFKKQINIVKDERRRVQIPLIPLEVKIKPRGEIWEGDKRIMKSDSSHLLFLLPSEYVFSIKEKGYLEEVREVVIGERDSQKLIEVGLNPEPKALPGTLLLQVHPSGQVFEGNRLLASFPPLKQKISLSPGAHTLKFISNEEGCEDVTKTFQIISGKSESAVIYFCFGQLNINSTPPGATITIDGSLNDLSGRPYGTTPQANLKLPVGPHTIVLEHPNYPVKTIQLIMQKNVKMNKSINFANK